jgi:hypothetical protein
MGLLADIRSPRPWIIKIKCVKYIDETHLTWNIMLGCVSKSPNIRMAGDGCTMIRSNLQSHPISPAWSSTDVRYLTTLVFVRTINCNNQDLSMRKTHYDYEILMLKFLLKYNLTKMNLAKKKKKENFFFNLPCHEDHQI